MHQLLLLQAFLHGIVAASQAHLDEYADFDCHGAAVGSISGASSASLPLIVLQPVGSPPLSSSPALPSSGTESLKVELLVDLGCVQDRLVEGHGGLVDEVMDTPACLELAVRS